MNIDILFSRKDDAGLIADENFVKKLAGVLIDFKTGQMTLEYADSDHLDLNVLLDTTLAPMFDTMMHMHVGSVKDGQIGQAYQIPIMVADDPYRGRMLAEMNENQYPLMAFERFIKSAVSGQPVHRNDVGDEDGRGCILGAAVPSALQFAPHLARRQTLEATPQMAPKGPGPSAPGLGMGGGGGGSAGGGFTGGNTGGHQDT